MKTKTYFKAFFILCVCTLIVKAKSAEKDKDDAPKQTGQAVEHRLSWDEWSDQMYTPKFGNMERPIKVFWDGAFIGGSSQSYEYLKRVIIESKSVVSIDLPVRPEREVNEDGSFYSSSFIASCDFLGNWFRAGVKLHFKRNGLPIHFRIIQVSGDGYKPNMGTNWDYFQFDMDGKRFDDGKDLLNELKNVEWQKGDLIFFVFPKSWNLVNATPQEGVLRPYLIQLQKEKFVDAAVANVGFGGASEIIGNYPVRR